MELKEKIYWQTTTEMPSDEILQELPARADVVVIGGGIPGLAAAYELARLGTRVVVFEKNTIGWGASSRNGGMALTGLKLDARTVEARYGSDLTHQLFEDAVASVKTLENIIKREKIECDFQYTGHLLLANKPSHYEAMQREAEWLALHFKHETRLVPKNDLSSEIGSQVYQGGLVDEGSAGLNPARYVAGLAKAAVQAGAKLCARAPVNKVEPKPGGFQLMTDRGEVFASQVLVTSGGYTSTATPKLQRLIIPIGSYIIATECLPDELAHQLSPHNRMIFDYKHYLNYFRLSADNRMIFGGRAAFFPETDLTIRESARILRQEMIHVYPQLKDVNIEYAWGGTLDFSFDLMPHAGLMDGIAYALGFAGHGVALGTHLGTCIAKAILEGKVNELPYAKYAFPGAPLGLYNGNPWFLPLIGAWHRLLDLVQ